MANLDSGVGVYAPDAESYTTFKALFDPIIEVSHFSFMTAILQEYHGGFSSLSIHPDTDFGETRLGKFAELDKEGKYIMSTRISLSRSLEEFPFIPYMTEADFKNVELFVKGEFLFMKMTSSLTGLLPSLTGDLKGDYFPFSGLNVVEMSQLSDEYTLFAKEDKCVD